MDKEVHLRRALAAAAMVVVLVLGALALRWGISDLPGEGHAAERNLLLGSQPSETTPPPSPAPATPTTAPQPTATSLPPTPQPPPAPVAPPPVVGAQAQPPAAPPPAPPPPPPPPPPPTPAPPVQASGTWDRGYAAQVLAGINRNRAAAGLPALAPESRLTSAAEAYARQMLETGWYEHTGPDGRTFIQRIEDAGFPFTVPFGEVLAWATGYVGPDVIVNAWMNSPAHREQILNPLYGLAGIGCYFAPNGGPLRCAMDLAGS